MVQRLMAATAVTAAATDTDAGAASWNPGLLGRPWRPSVARAAWSLEEAGQYVTTLLARAAASL